MRRLCSVATLVSFLAPCTALSAQESADRSELKGRVWQSGDSSVVVAGAEVQIVDAGMRRYADRDGRFQFAGVTPGSHELRVRMLGYQPYSTRFEISETSPDEQIVPLKRLPNALTRVVIEGRMVKVPARYEEAYRRGGLGSGKFFTREDIERLHPYDVKSMLGTLPGVMVNDRGVTFQRCEAPYVQVYIDGMRMTRWNHGDEEADRALRIVPPVAIQAMEVYRGHSQVPAEFLDNACAVVAIWTKAY